MIDLYEAKQAITGMDAELTALGKSMDLPAIDARLSALMTQSEDPAFWNDQKLSLIHISEPTRH